MIGILSSEEIEEVLRHSVFGRIGCHDKGRTYVVPVNFIYDGSAVICHSAAGLKIQMMRNNPEVCLQVDIVRDFMNWKSVVAWGTYTEISDTAEQQAAMKLFVDRTMKIKISETAVLPETAPMRIHPQTPGHITPIVYKIILHEKTGRYEMYK